MKGGYENKWICATFLTIPILFSGTILSLHTCRTCVSCPGTQEYCFCKITPIFGIEERWSRWRGRYEQFQGDRLYSFVTCRNIRPDSRLGEDVCVDNDCKYITFLNSDIKVLRSNYFIYASYIQEIYLNSSGIQQIQLGAFSGISKLQILHIEDNKIEEISKGHLNSLITLENLDLHQNAISLIEDESLFGLTNLTILDLSHNKLKTIPVRLFDSLQNIKKLNLSCNYLTTIDFISNSMQQLNTLDLSNNEIEILEKCFIETKMVSLFLQENEISYLNESCFPTSLKILNVGNNNLTELGNLVLETLINLNSLDFSHNHIRRISIGLFKDCNQLRKLDISQNEIDSLRTGVFSGVSNLTFLNISYLNLTKLDPHTFSFLTNLKIFDFDNNDLDDIDVTIFNHLTSLEKIYISKNDFSCSVVASIISQSKMKKFSVVYDNIFTTENVKGLPCKQNNHTMAKNPIDNSDRYSEYQKMKQKEIIDITNKLQKDVKDLMNSEKISLENILSESSKKYELVLREYQNMQKTEKLDLKKYIKDLFSDYSKSEFENNSVNTKSIHKNIEQHFGTQNMEMQDSFMKFSKTMEKTIGKFENFAINALNNITKTSTRILNRELNVEKNSSTKNQMKNLSTSIDQLKIFAVLICSICILYFIIKNVSVLCWKWIRRDTGSVDLHQEMSMLQNY